MDCKSNKLIKSMLGEDFFEVLKKSSVFKQDSKTVTNVEELKIGLNIVPRTVMSYLIANLSHMKIDDNKELDLPFADDCTMHIVKKDADSFSGYLYSKGKKMSEFENRSIPGLGLVLMTVLEIYDIEHLRHSREEEKESFDVKKLQDVIDERMRLHSLINRVVDEKIAQRDAVDILIKEKIAQALRPVEIKEETKSDKLKAYIDQKKKKEEVYMEKSEGFHCHDCGADLYSGGKNITLCICYGEDWNKDIKLIKNEKGTRMKFPKSMDGENIEMLLKTLKQVNRK